MSAVAHSLDVSLQISQLMSNILFIRCFLLRPGRPREAAYCDQSARVCMSVRGKIATVGVFIYSFKLSDNMNNKLDKE